MNLFNCGVPQGSILVVLFCDCVLLVTNLLYHMNTPSMDRGCGEQAEDIIEEYEVGTADP